MQQGTEIRIENQIPMVAVERLTPLVSPELYPRSKPFEIISLRSPAERQHLNRQRMPRAEVGRQLTLIHHDDFPATNLGQNLLPEQRPSPTFDQVELGINFVRTVDREIDGDCLLGRIEHGDA